MLHLPRNLPARILKNGSMDPRVSKPNARSPRHSICTGKKIKKTAGTNRFVPAAHPTIPFPGKLFPGDGADYFDGISVARSTTARMRVKTVHPQKAAITYIAIRDIGALQSLYCVEPPTARTRTLYTVPAVRPVSAIPFVFGKMPSSCHVVAEPTLNCT
jgi:hypothetical protein